MGGFFSKALTQQGIKPVNEHQFVNLVQEKFHAVAIALIDSLQESPRGNDPALKQILELFYKCFPKYINNQLYLTLPERMQKVLNNPRKSELVESMAYVLRQLAVDELYKNPLKYKDAFNGASPDTAKNYFRMPQTELAESALNALAHKLEIAITLSYLEPGKGLRMKVICGDASGQPNPKLEIQVQEGHYFPGVAHDSTFTHMDHLIAGSLKELNPVNEEEGTLADILYLIAEDNKLILQTYTEWYKRILKMVDANELSYEQLRDLYISCLPEVFVGSTQKKSPPNPTNVNTPTESNQHTIKIRANALANWISTKLINPEQVINQIERQPAAGIRR